MRELAKAWRAALADELPGAIVLRHELHASPQVSGAEDPTADRVVEELGLPAERIAGTGRLLRIGPDGPAVGLRAEMDALPMAERTGASFASTNGAMHACGHDVHLAALVAVVRAARRLELPAGLLVLLQPREEVGPTGAADVVASGRLLDHHVRALIAAHVQPLVAAGHVTSDAGPVNASVDEVDIVITGRGGHGAYPQLAADPVPPLCRAVLELPATARAAIDPLQPVVVTIPQIAGSGAPNVIPGTALASGTVRTMRERDRALIHETLARAVAGLAESAGCTGEYRVRRGEPALINDPALAVGSAAWLARFGVPTASFASCGSDDFATYGPQVPILMQFVGVGEGPMLHDARFLPGDHVVGHVATALLAGWLAGTRISA